MKKYQILKPGKLYKLNCSCIYEDFVVGNCTLEHDFYLLFFYDKHNLSTNQIKIYHDDILMFLHKELTKWYFLYKNHLVFFTIYGTINHLWREHSNLIQPISESDY